MILDRAAEEAAIAAAIAAGKLTIIPPVDSVDRAIDQWRREKDARTGSGGGMKAMMEARRRAQRVKAKTKPATPVAEPKPKRAHKKKVAVTPAVTEPWFAAAMRGPRAKPHSVAEPVGVESAGAVEPERGAIAELAYALYERDGWVHGLDREHWLTAEAILRGEVT